MKGIVHKNTRLGKLPEERVQENTRDLTRVLQACPFLVGRLKRIRFASAARVVNHSLGVPASFLVLRDASGAGADFWEDADQTGIDIKKQLRINCNSDVVADLWLFPRARETTPE